MGSRLNCHGHLLPLPEQIPTWMREAGIFWITEDRQFMRQGEWRRPITDSNYFLEEKLVWMDQHRIDHEVILNLSQLYCNGMDCECTQRVLRFQNDFNAGVQHRYPERFTAGFVVQVAYLEDALIELRRCVEELDLQLLCLPTHFLTQGGEWRSVAHPDIEPLFALANEYELARDIHPYDGPRMINLADQFWRFHLVWMCAQTADTYHLYTTLGYHERFPKLRVAFAHGNQYGQVNVGRRRQGYYGRPDLFPDAADPETAVGMNNLFFDTLVHDVYAFRLLIDRQGAPQVIAGLDDPYPLGEIEGVADSYPGKVIDQAVERAIISSQDRDRIWWDNGLRWLAGARVENFLERIKPKSKI